MTLEVDNKPAAGPVQLEQFGRCKTWSWLPLDQIELETVRQIHNIAKLPNAVAVAVMPDAHKGYGMPIGTALATEGAVVPYAVGVDIGCGMVAVRFGVDARELEREDIRRVLEGIYKRVPVGQPTKKNRNQGSHRERQNSEVLREWFESPLLSTPFTNTAVAEALRNKCDYQVGTLGGGNHFIELQADEDNTLWLMLHSGSRGFGYAIGQSYYKRALEWCERYRTPLPDKELAFLSLDTEDGQAYMRDMGFAMRFAEESRARMEQAAYESMRVAGFGGSVGSRGQRIETHHNFAAIEQHFGKTVVVHRKGAVRTTAELNSAAAIVMTGGIPLGAAVTIPGSMETGSYIGFGKANKLAMNTCSHGAGRRLGRKAYTREVGSVDIRAQMAAKGIELVCPPDSDVLDEAGGAYKDLEDVMRWQSDLVTPTVKLRPLGCVKG